MFPKMTTSSENKPQPGDWNDHIIYFLRKISTLYGKI